MVTQTLQSETYFPADSLREIDDFLRAHEMPVKYFLSSTGPDHIEIPEEVHRILRQVAEAMSQGLAITVAPVSQTLTTQQAADLLGVSRPTLIKVLDDGKIPFERIGAHRRIRLRDVLEYRARRREEQYAAIDATAVDIDDDGDIETTLQELRATRKKVAQRRREARLTR